MNFAVPGIEHSNAAMPPSISIIHPRTALAPVVIDGKPLSTLPAMPPQIRIAGWDWGGHRYYILVNTSEQKVDYNWNIPDSQLCFEPDNSMKKSTLEPLRRRIYRCK